MSLPWCSAFLSPEQYSFSDVFFFFSIRESNTIPNFTSLVDSPCNLFLTPCTWSGLTVGHTATCLCIYTTDIATPCWPNFGVPSHSLSPASSLLHPHLCPRGERPDHHFLFMSCTSICGKRGASVGNAGRKQVQIWLGLLVWQLGTSPPCWFLPNPLAFS